MYSAKISTFTVFKEMPNLSHSYHYYFLFHPQKYKYSEYGRVCAFYDTALIIYSTCTVLMK